MSIPVTIEDLTLEVNVHPYKEIDENRVVVLGSSDFSWDEVLLAGGNSGNCPPCPDPGGPQRPTVGMIYPRGF